MRPDEIAARYWAEDLTWYSAPEWPNVENVSGRENVLRLLHEDLIDYIGHFRLDVTEHIDLGARLLVGFTLRGEGASSGAPVEMVLYHVVSVRDGRVYLVRNYADRTQAIAEGQ